MAAVRLFRSRSGILYIQGEITIIFFFFKKEGGNVDGMTFLTVFDSRRLYTSSLYGPRLRFLLDARRHCF